MANPIGGFSASEKALADSLFLALEDLSPLGIVKLAKTVLTCDKWREIMEDILVEKLTEARPIDARARRLDAFRPPRHIDVRRTMVRARDARRLGAWRKI